MNAMPMKIESADNFILTLLYVAIGPIIIESFAHIFIPLEVTEPFNRYVLGHIFIVLLTWLTVPFKSVQSTTKLCKLVTFHTLLELLFDE